MTTQEIKILDFVNENYDGPVDNKVNIVFNKYDIDFNKMDQVREYFKMNILQHDTK